ncbi:MAG: hypothetical protein R8G66_25755 [Cytophagales bacterium]|nr:hypothetical protein [Cytophagales bacterium]
MNKKIIVGMGLPLTIRNKAGKRATIELNKNDFVVCRYHSDRTFYLQNAQLTGWYPAHWLRKVLYLSKVKLSGFRSRQLKDN